MPVNAYTSAGSRLYCSDFVHHFQVQRKMLNVWKVSKYYVELCMPVATRSSLITCGDYSECAMQIAFLVVWVGHGAGMQCSLAPLFQFSTVAYSRKIQWPICNFLLPCAASMCTQAYCFSTVLYIKVQWYFQLSTGHSVRMRTNQSLLFQ